MAVLSMHLCNANCRHARYEQWMYCTDINSSPASPCRSLTVCKTLPCSRSAPPLRCACACLHFCSWPRGRVTKGKKQTRHRWQKSERGFPAVQRSKGKSTSMMELSLAAPHATVQITLEQEPSVFSLSTPPALIYNIAAADTQVNASSIDRALPFTATTFQQSSTSPQQTACHLSSPSTSAPNDNTRQQTEQ